jgi:ATP-dependent exoDNAse (exonuclease V) alpha subunit
VDWVGDRGKLWNGIEAKEDTHNRRAKAQLAREVEIALPRELTPEQNYELMRRYVDDQFVARGMVADVAIHERPAADGLTNWHVHILLSLRSVGPDGFGLKERAWNSEEMVEAWREGWETYCNEALAAAGSDARIDRRTLDAQGILRAPTVHMGKEAFHAQERGQEPKRVQPSMLDRSLQPFEQQIRRCGHVRLLMPPEAGQSWSGRMATHTARPEEAELDGDAIGR